jgi:predicted Zn finger-like uncharacterized protein
MTIVARCGHCRANLRVPDALDGKKAKCPKCGKVFQVAAAEADEAPIASRPISPRPKAGAALPESRRRVRREDDEDDDKPRARPKKRRAKKKASNQGLIVGLSVGAGVLVIGLVVVVGVVMAKSRNADLPAAPPVAQAAVPPPPAAVPAAKVEPAPAPAPAPQQAPAPVAEVQTPVAEAVPDESERPQTAPQTPSSPIGTKLAPGTKITVRAQIQGSPPKFQGDFNKHVTQRIEIALRKLGYVPVPDGGLILQVNAQIAPTGGTVKVRTIGPPPPPAPRPVRPVKGQPPPPPPPAPQPTPPREQSYPLEQISASLVLTDMRGSAVWKHDHKFDSITRVFRTTDPPSEMREEIWRNFDAWAAADAVITMKQ